MTTRGPRPQPSRAQWLRRLAYRRKDSVAFVFSGGGPLGALQVGTLKALYEHDIRPDLAVGTSVGALNATWTAFDPTPDGVARLESTWLRMKDSDLFPGGGRFKASWARMLVRGNRIHENIGIRRVIETSLGLPRFEDAQIPLAVTATDLETGAERIFSSGDIIDPLLASTAMPGIFPPVPIGGRNYIDGGVANNVPIAPAVEMGATTVYVMDATSHSRQRRPLNRPVDYLLHAFTLARGQRFTLEARHYEEKVKLVVLPSPWLDFFVPFASLEYTSRLIEMAYKETKRFLESGSLDQPLPPEVSASVTPLS
ncbi:MAG: patatin-like phospholipase family protein [Actinobacteria bacterium]|nr:patatin-like phospholipase family protein [Actinomycetota bacterium]